MANRRERAAAHASPRGGGRRSAQASPAGPARPADVAALSLEDAPQASAAASWALPQLSRRLESATRDSVDALALSADGTRVFTAGGARGDVRCWSATASGGPELLWTAANNGHPGGVTALAVALDDQGCFSAGRDGEIRLWSAAGALAETLRGHGEGGVTCLVSHGATLVSGGDEGKVRTWHAGTGEAGRLLRGEGCRVTALRLSPSGDRVASGGSDRAVRIFDIAAGAVLAELTGHGGWVSALAWAPGGAQLLSGSYDGDVRVWAAPPGGGNFALRAVLRAQAIDADGAQRSAAPEDRMVAALMIEPSAPRRNREADAEAEARDPFDDAMDVDADDVAEADEPPVARRVFVGTMDGCVTLWDLRTRRREDVARAGAGAAVCALSHCADVSGARTPLCVSAHHDGALRAWRRVRSRRPGASCGLAEAWTLRGAHADWATQLAPSRAPGALRDGDADAPMLIYSAGEDGMLAAWRVAAPRAWSRGCHVSFPVGFRAAVAAFLCTLHRMTASGAAAAEPEAASAAGAAARSGAPAVPPRLRRSAKGGSASPASPLSPEPCGDSSPAPRRGRRSLLPLPLAPAEALPAPLRLHGATRDALVDLVVSALARQAYPDGQYVP